MSDDNSSIVAELRNARGDLNDITNQLKKLRSDLDDVSSKLNGTIRENTGIIVTTVAAGTKQLQASLKETSYFAGKVELAKQLAELSTMGDVIKLLQSALNEKVDIIQKKKNEVQEQFSRKEIEIIESYKTDLRRVGAHIYEILEKEYGENIENRYVTEEGKRGLLDVIARYFDDARRLALDCQWEQCHSALRSLVSHRKSFRTMISQKTTKLRDYDSSRLNVSIPAWKIEREGIDQKTIVKPSEIIEQANVGQAVVIKEYDECKNLDMPVIEFGDSDVMPSSLTDSVCAELMDLVTKGCDPRVLHELVQCLKDNPPMIAKEVL